MSSSMPPEGKTAPDRAMKVLAAVAGLVGGGMLAGAGLFMVAVASCHSMGGWCTGDPTAEDLRWLVFGGVLITLAGPVAVLGMTRRLRFLLLATFLAAGFALSLVVPRWP